MSRAATTVNFHEAKRHAVYARDSYTCVYCGHHDEKGIGIGLSLDHITARNLGGAPQHTKDNEADNLLTACGACNTAKLDRTPREWSAYMKSKGMAAINWTALRRQAARPIDIKVGEQNAATARAYREAKYGKGANAAVVNMKERAEAKADAARKAQEAAEKATAEKTAGPGVRHDAHGRFEAKDA